MCACLSVKRERMTYFPFSVPYVKEATFCCENLENDYLNKTIPLTEAQENTHRE